MRLQCGQLRRAGSLAETDWVRRLLALGREATAA